MLTRDNDLLTQGILVKSIVDSLRRTPDSAGLVLLDVFQPPDAPSRPHGSARRPSAGSSFAVIAAGNEPNGEGATALALGLRDELSAADAGVNSVTNGLRRRLAKEPVSAQVIAATGDASLAAEKRPAPPPAASIAPCHRRRPCPSPLSERRRNSSMVDEDQMSDSDRRQVQAVLANVGYYSGRIDGTFGPETRAAIRRYQFEIKAELTGRLTAEQATRLVNSMR